MKCVKDITNIIKVAVQNLEYYVNVFDKALTGLRELTSLESSAMGKGISNGTTQTNLS